jgi:hypothetical protein
MTPSGDRRVLGHRFLVHWVAVLILVEGVIRSRLWLHGARAFLLSYVISGR